MKRQIFYTSLLGRLLSRGLFSRSLLGDFAELGSPLGDGGVGVELQHGPDVLQRVGLNNSPLNALVGGAEDLSDLLSLQKLRQVGDGHLGLGQVPAGLVLGGHTPRAVDRVQLLESSFSPDAETADVTTRSQLQKVQLADL